MLSALAWESTDSIPVLAVVRSDTLNEEGLRLLADGGEIEVPLDEDDEEAADILENAAQGGHGDGEIGECSIHVSDSLTDSGYAGR